MTDELVHKRLRSPNSGRDERSRCGRYGYRTARWRNVTCPVCKKHRPKGKQHG